MSQASFLAARVLIWFRLDYIARDSFQLGTARGINIQRLLKSCRVIDGELAWSSNDQNEVLKVFKRRWEIHNKCTLSHIVLRCHSFLRLAIDYSDETSMALDYMFGDALLAANGHLGLSSRVDDPGRYVHLTDTILHQIRQSTNEVGPYCLIMRTWDLYIDVVTYRNSQLRGHYSVEWIRATSTGALGRGSSGPRSNLKSGTFLLPRIPFQPPPMTYPFRQERTMGRWDPTTSSSVCTRYTATSMVIVQANMLTRLIEFRKYQRSKSSSAPDGDLCRFYKPRRAEGMLPHNPQPSPVFS